MRSRIAAVPALALSLVIAASGAALGQSEQPGTLDELDSSALESLCAANAPDEAALQTCIEVVQTILAPDGDSTADGDVAAVASYRVRFAGVVIPGETVVTKAWRTDEGIVLVATTEERGEPVLTNGLVGLR